MALIERDGQIRTAVVSNVTQKEFASGHHQLHQSRSHFEHG
jgi:hypothetical protein